MRKTALLWLLLSPFAFAQPALTRTQTQELSRLKGPAYDQALRRIEKRAQTRLVGQLTQQSVDAVCEWFLFATALIDGQSPADSPPGLSFASHFQQVLVRAWPKLAPDAQKTVVDFPAYWSALRQDWAGLSPEQQKARIAGWRSVLKPLLQASGRRELARACLTDLHSTYSNPQATPDELQRALMRIETAARRMAAEGDPESKALARQLQNAMVSVQAQQDQKRALQEIEAQRARISTPAGADYNTIFRQINQARR